MTHALSPARLAAAALVLASFAMTPSAEAATGLSYLKVGAGARAIALGNAVVSNVADPTANYWNPGALAFAPGTEIELMHNESFQTVRYEFAGLSHRKGRHGFGAAFHGVWTDDLTGLDVQGNSTGSFGYAGIAIAGNYALALNETMGLGIGVEYLREQIDRYEATGLAASIGFQAREVLPRTDVGFAALHLGSSMKYETEEFDIPTTFQGGVTHRVPVASMDGEFRLSAEVRAVRDEDTQIVFGSEYRYQDFTSLQVGYQTNHDTQDVAFGIGLGRGRVRGQYAFSPFGQNLGDQHRFSVRVGL